MNYKSWISLLLLEFFLIGCSPPAPATLPVQPNSPHEVSKSSQQANLGQSLPVSAQVTIAQQVIQLEVAQTPQQQAMGLMYRPSLADDRGMLFLFDPPRFVSFWMKNVAISLDMVFLREGRVEAISSNVPPCASEPCAVYGPRAIVDQVIELRGGRASELGLKVGDRLSVKPL